MLSIAIYIRNFLKKVNYENNAPKALAYIEVIYNC